MTETWVGEQSLTNESIVSQYGVIGLFLGTDRQTHCRIMMSDCNIPCGYLRIISTSNHHYERKTHKYII